MITLTGTQNSTVEILPQDGGQYLLDANGTFGSGTITVSISFDGGTTYSILTTDIGTDLAITDDYNSIVTLPGDTVVKFEATVSVTSVKLRLAKI